MPPFAVLVAFSGVKKALVTTGYNQRVKECAAAASVLLKAAGRSDCVPLLGNVTPEEYAVHQDTLSGPLARRVAHFFGESERVSQGVDAWRQGDLETFGRLMTESGRSSIENYECGSQPLIDLYDILIHTEGVYGVRFSGAGFRGCCVALVDSDAGEDALAHVREIYAARHAELARNALAVICQSDHSARILDVDSQSYLSRKKADFAICMAGSCNKGEYDGRGMQ